MANSNQPNSPRTTEEILREMEAMSGGSGASAPVQEESKSSSGSGGSGGGGALKSLLGFFVKVSDEEETKPAPTPASFPAQPATPPKQATPLAPQQRPAPRVSDLVAGESAPRFATPAANTQADLATKEFADLYREAGVLGSSCSVDELATLMENPTIASQPISVKIIAVNLALSAKGQTIETPVADAVRRDRTLDAYQSMLNERAQQVEQAAQTRIQQISQEVEEYLKRRQAEMDALRAESTTAKKQAIEFSIRREAEEQRLANLISPFLEGKSNPVSVGNQPEQSTPGGKA